MSTYVGTTALFEIRSTATAGNLGGGGFNPGNTHFPTDGAATVANGNSPVFTSASYNFVAGDIGAKIYIKSGSNWTSGWYPIISVAANAATLGAAIGGAIQLSNNRYITNTVAGCATVASPTSATWGIDYSQQNAAQFTATTGSGTTTAFTDATNVPAVNWIGNFLCLKTGTGLTAGFFECTNVSAGTVTLDRTAGASYSSVTYYMGGAISLGGSTTGITDAIAIALGSTSSSSSCRFFIRGNATYTPPTALTTTALSNSSFQTIYEGYNTNRGDRPSILSGTQPIFSMGSNSFTQSDATQMYSITGKGTGSGIFVGGTSNGNIGGVIYVGCKAINSDASGGGHAFNGAGFTNNIYIGCEGVAYSGSAFFTDNLCIVAGCYAHDSTIGINIGGANCSIIKNIVATCVTECIQSNQTGCLIWGNTLYGAENKFGIGINSATKDGIHMNNILYGFVSGFGGSVTNMSGIVDFNGYFNNTDNISATQSATFSGASDITINPGFINVSQITGTTATSSGTTLTDSGKNFTTAGVVAGRDYLRVKSGTGATVATYGIITVGTTTLTTDNTIGTSAGGNLVYQITIGRNFSIGPNLRALGSPGAFPAGLTTGYTDIGAVQRQEPTIAYAWND